MDDRTTGTTGAKRTRRSSTNAASDVVANDTGGMQREDASTASMSSHLYGESGSSAGEEGHGFMGRVRERASEQLNSQKNRATEGIGSAAQAVRQSTQHLRDQKHETIAQYIESAADQLDRFANRIKDKNVNELVDDAQRFARRQPALFIGGAFALGLFASRFLKSSSPDRQMSRMYGGDYYRDAGFDRPAYGGAGTVGTSGSAGAFGTSDTSGPGGASGTSGNVTGTPRDVPRRESF
jgi:hypothetical protein